MFIGIDVGGTTTDAVLTRGRTVLAEAAVTTAPHDLAGSVLAALDGVMRGVRPRQVERIVMSTTVITNLLAEKKTEPVGLILMPGPGTNPSSYELPFAHVVGGAIDYRGREIAPLDEDGLRAAGEALQAEGFSLVAVVGKFCQRNPTHERVARTILEEAHPDMIVECGHVVSGRLNFPRRAATAVLTLATRDRYREFAAEMGHAIQERGLCAPVFVMKADGGTLPLEYSLLRPVETIFSGPAASTMGALALAPQEESFIVLDVGGTTTDLALVLDGQPLLASKGARVQNLLTHVRAFAVKSVPIGGDSAVRVIDGCVVVGPDRMGPPACLGGPAPTPTDALRVIGAAVLGEEGAARRAMVGVAEALGITPEEASHRVLESVASSIAQEAEMMFAHWKNEPVYRVWEVVQPQHARPTLLVGVGGGAPSVAPAVASLLAVRCLVPEHAAVANAVGAAVARPTLTLTLSVDTSRGIWLTQEDGRTGCLDDSRLNLAGAERMALRMLAIRAEEAGIGDYAGEGLVTHSEVFNMIRGRSTTGRLMEVTVEIPAGVLSDGGFTSES